MHSHIKTPYENICLSDDVFLATHRELVLTWRLWCLIGFLIIVLLTRCRQESFITVQIATDA